MFEAQTILVSDNSLDNFLYNNNNNSNSTSVRIRWILVALKMKDFGHLTRVKKIC